VPRTGYDADDAQRQIEDSIHHPLDLIERDGVIAPVVEPRSARRLVDGHLLGDLQLAAVLQVRGNARGAEAVGADFGPDCRRTGGGLFVAAATPLLMSDKTCYQTKRRPCLPAPWVIGHMGAAVLHTSSACFKKNSTTGILKWTPLSRPFFARNKLISGGV
jgi:hypothetical protein